MNTDKLNIAINKVAELYRKQLADDGVNASGNLSNFTTEYEYDGKHFILYFNLADYWKYAEYGRGPGKFPPLDAIKNWIQVKPIIPVPDVRGKIPTTNQLAFLIGRKIANEGTQGKHSLTKAMLSTKMDSIVNEIKNALIEDIKEELTKNIKEIIK